MIYADADKWFLSGVEPALQALGDSTIGHSPDRFSPGKEYLAKYGIHNGGLRYFRRTAEAEPCLRERTVHEAGLPRPVAKPNRGGSCDAARERKRVAFARWQWGRFRWRTPAGFLSLQRHASDQQRPVVCALQRLPGAARPRRHSYPTLRQPESPGAGVTASTTCSIPP